MITLRISQGSLDALRGAYRGLAEPRTLYLLQYSPAGCAASCTFCAQARGGDRLGRIPWPAISLQEIFSAGLEGFTRICLQTVLKPGFLEEAALIVKALSGKGLPISLASTPAPTYWLEELKRLGVDFLGVGLDAFTPRIHLKVSKPYPWATYIDYTRRALRVFGPGHVYVHLVAGLGETPSEALRLLDMLYGMGARAALFPLVSTRRPWKTLVDKRYYRRLQLAAWLLNTGRRPSDFFTERLEPTEKLLGIKGLEHAFLTQGCPGCNRPFYTERPGDMYNYPSPALLGKNLEAAMREAGLKR